MLITLQLFGRFREFSESPEVQLELPNVTTAGDFRAAFDVWAQANWPTYRTALLSASAIATETDLLHASSPLPANGRLAILPPVSGG